MHRPAVHVSVLVDVPVVNRDRDLRGLGNHAEERKHPHPEYRPRTTYRQRRGDPRHVTHPHGAGQRRRGCLEGRHTFPVRVAGATENLPERLAENVAKVTDLKEAAAHGQKNGDEGDENHRPRPPHQVADPADELEKALVQQIPPHRNPASSCPEDDSAQSATRGSDAFIACSCCRRRNWNALCKPAAVERSKYPFYSPTCRQFA